MREVYKREVDNCKTEKRENTHQSHCTSFGHNHCNNLYCMSKTKELALPSYLDGTVCWVERAGEGKSMSGFVRGNVGN